MDNFCDFVALLVLKRLLLRCLYIHRPGRACQTSFPAANFGLFSEKTWVKKSFSPFLMILRTTSA